MAVARQIHRRRPTEARAAEQPWSEAAADAFEAVAREIGREGRRVHRGAGVDAVHDLRVATRRARTAVTIFEEAAPRDDVRPVRRELARLADRLGTVRDLDVMLESVQTSGGAGPDDGLEPLRRAWVRERDEAGRRLLAELGRGRYRRFLKRAGRLADSARAASPDPGEPVLEVRHSAPAKVWSSFGRLLAFRIEPATADQLMIHRMRIAAKRFRYTLEMFEPALGPEARPLAERVTALQDLAGEAHDAGVAAARARTVLAGESLDQRELAAIERFAADRDRRAGQLAEVAERVAAIQGLTFRRTLARLLAAM